MRGSNSSQSSSHSARSISSQVYAKSTTGTEIVLPFSGSSVTFNKAAITLPTFPVFSSNMNL